ncbi:MAG: thymidine kinase [Gammaproteobacteria bacterium]|nr:thymidine kinase [Gammaproteobacteria bacterium]
MAKLYFYYSAMNAGKSTTLLQSSYNYQERGMNTLLFTPSLDNRFHEGTIHSRIGLKADAISFDNESNLYDYVKQFLDQPGQALHCVLIDEAQFLNKAQVFELAEVADALSIPVLAYGLRSDFRGEPFEGSQYLLAWADELIEIKTVCHCGKKATMNVRIGEDQQPVTTGNQIEIGGNDKYISVCRKHFKRMTHHHER